MSNPSRKLVLLSACLSVAFCNCHKYEQASEVSAEPANIVAKIDDYIITKHELEQRLMQELRPDPYEQANQTEPVDTETVLLKIMAERAMIIEARKNGLVEDEMIKNSIRRFRERRLVSMLLQKQVQSKVVVTESEIKQKLKDDPTLDQTRARVLLEQEKTLPLLEEYYSQLLEKFNLQKVKANFSDATSIHQRLLLRPKQPRSQSWILTSQVRNELTQEEKNIVLATYEGGEISLKDWFDTLMEMAPPRRPRDLGTPAGVERLLDITVRMPIMVAESKLMGLDKDEDLISKVRELEDRRLLAKVQQEKTNNIKDPTEEQIVAYFNKHKEVFAKPESLEIDQIWCKEYQAAKKAKDELNAGKDFESVKQSYSLDTKAEPFNTYPGGEGIFWNDLWHGEPNDTIGPIKGFYQNEIKWRIVKILQKKPSKPIEYSSDINSNVKRNMMSEKREKVLAKYRTELLEKYPYKIYTARIKNIDPLNIP